MRFLHVDHKEVQDIEYFKRCIQSCKHIRHWFFLVIEIKYKYGLVLPETVLSYQDIGTNFLLLDKHHTHLESIVVDGSGGRLEKILKENNFFNLKNLKLYRCFSYHSKLMKCSNLRVLKIMNCHLPYTYLINLSDCVKNNFLELHIESDTVINNEHLLSVINSFNGLRELTLTKMNGITPMFLLDVKHEKLKFIFIRICKHFNDKKSQDELESIKSSLSFTVHNDPKFIDKFKYAS